MESKRVVEKRVLLTPEENRELDGLIYDLRKQLGCPIALSHLLRASVRILCKGKNRILRRAKKSPELRRPPNRDQKAMLKFERQLGQIILDATRGSRFRL